MAEELKTNNMPGKHGPVYKMKYQGNHKDFPFKSSPTEFKVGKMIVNRVKSHVKGKIQDFKNKFSLKDNSENDSEKKDSLGLGIIKDIAGGVADWIKTPKAPTTPMAKRSPQKFASLGRAISMASGVSGGNIVGGFNQAVGRTPSGKVDNFGNPMYKKKKKY